MIIKSMSRKEPSYAQLIAYLSRDASDRHYELRHNVLGQDIVTLTAEFEENGSLLAKRKNGVTMYHEVISITRPKALAPEAQKAILRDIALDYIRQRAPQNLAFGCLHDDHAEHLHYHFIVSANPLGQSRRYRLDKREFRQIQVGLETKVRALHPELQQSISIAKRAKPRALTQPGQELKRRTGATPKRDQLKARLSAVFAAAQSASDLNQRLTAERLELYQRGKAIGIRDLTTGRNHRLATLGLEAELQAMGRRFSAAQAKAQLPASPTPQKEKPMNLFEALLQGLSAAIDIGSISRDTGKQLDSTSGKISRVVTSPPPRIEQTQRIVSGAVRNGIQSNTAPMTETERIAAERAKEMSDLRDEQERQNARQGSNQTKR